MGCLRMNNIFVTDILIDNVRHLKQIHIPLSQEGIKHLIITGKNGSGKTSVLQAMSTYINSAATSDRIGQLQRSIATYRARLDGFENQQIENNERIKIEKKLNQLIAELDGIKNGIELDFNVPADTMYYHFEKGEFVIAYYKAERVLQTAVPQHVEKIELKDKYAITESPRNLFVKYLLDLKVTEALARNNNNYAKADSIHQWFSKFQDLLRTIFNDATLKLVFEEDTFRFFIHEKNREPFDFNSLSSGYSAVLDIVLDLILRMEKATGRTFCFDLPGIVVIDEIETHLHLDLQKNILKFLTTVFPNIQFIVSTHSPFILNSLENTVIYDLENKILVENGLANIPYEGIVEGYFNADALSGVLKNKFSRYQELIAKEMLTLDDYNEIAELEVYLNEIPDYLALNLTTEYQRLKLEFYSREDV